MSETDAKPAEEPKKEDKGKEEKEEGGASDAPISQSTKEVVQKIPLLSTRAGPRGLYPLLLPWHSVRQ